MEKILSTELLTKQYKDIKAVDSINININKGDIYGFIGRNGAGKTTTLKMIAGLANPTSGSFSLFGIPYEQLISQKAFSNVGCLIESPGLYNDMSAFDNVYLKCILMGINNKDYAKDLLRLVDLDPNSRKKTRGFSLGMKQRLGIAIALVGEPKLIILDEPTNGLDPQGILEIREIILKLNREKEITFIIEEALSKNILRKNRAAYYFGTDLIGNGIEDVIAYLKDKKNQDIYLSIKSELESK